MTAQDKFTFRRSKTGSRSSRTRPNYVLQALPVINLTNKPKKCKSATMPATSEGRAAPNDPGSRPQRLAMGICSPDRRHHLGGLVGVH